MRTILLFTPCREDLAFDLAALPELCRQCDRRDRCPYLASELEPDEQPLKLEAAE
jgi:hypothetical protein